MVTPARWFRPQATLTNSSLVSLIGGSSLIGRDVHPPHVYTIGEAEGEGLSSNPANRWSSDNTEFLSCDPLIADAGGVVVGVVPSTLEFLREDIS